MKTKVIVFILAIAAIIIIGYKMTGNVVKESENPKVSLKTNMGDIIIELYPDKAPITVENFLTYVNGGAYDETVFHRVIDNFMIQGGGFTEDGNQKPTNPPIKLESDNELKNEKYTIAMARTMIPDSATNQFFINTNNNDFLNYEARNQGYAVFGRVIEGMDVVDKIGKVKTTTKNSMPDWPVEEVKIIKAEVL